jgi:hypothetical protein
MVARLSALHAGRALPPTNLPYLISGEEEKSRTPTHRQFQQQWIESEGTKYERRQPAWQTREVLQETPQIREPHKLTSGNKGTSGVHNPLLCHRHSWAGPGGAAPTFHMTSRRLFSLTYKNAWRYAAGASTEQFTRNLNIHSSRHGINKAVDIASW